MRLIDADELMKQVRLMANRSSLGETRPSEISGLEVIGLIVHAPEISTVSAGCAKWDYVGGNNFSKYHRCTNCTAMYDFTPTYCPNCGAKMDA